MKNKNSLNAELELTRRLLGVADSKTNEKLKQIASLLVSWEDGNISDYEFCNKAGNILGLGGWTWKGSKQLGERESKQYEKLRKLTKAEIKAVERVLPLCGLWLADGKLHIKYGGKTIFAGVPSCAYCGEHVHCDCGKAERYFRRLKALERRFGEDA